MATLSGPFSTITLPNGLTIKAGPWRFNVPTRLRVFSFRCPWFELALFWRRRPTAPILELSLSGPAPAGSALPGWEVGFWRHEADVPNIPYRVSIGAERLRAIAGAVASEEERVVRGDPQAPKPQGVLHAADLLCPSVGVPPCAAGDDTSQHAKIYKADKDGVRELRGGECQTQKLYPSEDALGPDGRPAV